MKKTQKVASNWGNICKTEEIGRGFAKQKLRMCQHGEIPANDEAGKNWTNETKMGENWRAESVNVPKIGGNLQTKNNKTKTENWGKVEKMGEVGEGGGGGGKGGRRMCL